MIWWFPAKTNLCQPFHSYKANLLGQLQKWGTCQISPPGISPVGRLLHRTDTSLPFRIEVSILMAATELLKDSLIFTNNKTFWVQFQMFPFWINPSFSYCLLAVRLKSVKSALLLCFRTTELKSSWVQCGAVWCSAVRCGLVNCGALQFNVVQLGALQCIVEVD